MSSLVIRHHSATYRLPTGRETEKLDEACSTLLEAALSSKSLGAGEGMWLIRSLDVQTTAMAHWTADTLSRSLANQVGAAIRDTLRRGPDGSTVLWFPSRGALLARLLVEVVEGTAKGAWYFAGFSDLVDQSAGSVLLELSRREPRSVREAVCYLLPPEERLLLKHVSASEAEQILKILAQDEAPASVAALEAAVTVLEHLARSGDLVEPASKLAFQIYLSAMRAAPDMESLGLARASLQIATLVSTFGLSTSGEAAKAWGAQDWRTLKSVLGSESVARLAAFEPVPPEIRRRLATVGQNPGVGDLAEEESTLFGGIFLLLPLLELFDWQGCFAGCPGIEEHEPAQVAQLLTLAACYGANKARRVFDDPVLRRCLGIVPELTLDDVSAWIEALPDRNGLEERWVAGLARAGSVGSTVRTLAASPRGPMLVDGAKGVWMGRAKGAPLVEIGLDEETLHLGALFPQFAELLLLTSQALLREFAWRLPGFFGSSIPFLHENFLGFSATLVVEDDRAVATLGNPPLHIVLSLNGMNRKRFRLPYSGGVKWTLAPRS